MVSEAKINGGFFDLCMMKQGWQGELLSAMMAYTKWSQAKRDNTFTGISKIIIFKALFGILAFSADEEMICKAGERLEITNHKHVLLITE